MPDKEPTDNSSFWDNDLRTVSEHYIKVSDLSSSISEVTLLLGNTYQDEGTRIDLCKMRLIMSHHDFLEFAEDVQKQANFLKKLYQGQSPGLSATAEEVDIAWKEIYGD